MATGDTTPASTTSAATVDTTTPVEEGAAPATGQDSLLGGSDEAPAASDGSPGDEGAKSDPAGDKPEGSDDAPPTGESSQTAPDTYADFNFPEGMTADSAMLAEATPVFKELGLTQDAAQKLVDLQSKLTQAGSQRQLDDFNQLMKDWQGQSKADSEFGGDAFDQNVGIAKQAIQKFGTPELTQLLNDHGVGNHPEVIRLLYRVGKHLGEDVPGNNGQQAHAPKDAVEILYGKND